MVITQSAFSELGVSLASNKVIGPTQRITYLGIEDTVGQTIHLPPDKLNELQLLLYGWVDRHKCTKRELLSLIGSLSFASKVVKPGRMFLRRLIDVSTSVSCMHHHITLNSEARADILWWCQFLPTWNDVAMIQEDIETSHALQLFTDASSLGFGAVYGDWWMSVGWPPSAHVYDTNFLELFAIVAAVLTWGAWWILFSLPIIHMTVQCSVVQSPLPSLGCFGFLKYTQVFFYTVVCCLIYVVWGIWGAHVLLFLFAGLL